MENFKLTLLGFKNGGSQFCWHIMVHAKTICFKFCMKKYENIQVLYTIKQIK